MARASLSRDVDDLDATGLLEDLQATVRARRAVEVRDLLLVAQWADLHASDPRRDPRPRDTTGMPLPRPPGSEQLVQVGGEGTPWVRDLSLCELAIARGVHPLAARAATADVLDLRHRLPLLWAAVAALECEVRVARKVASLSRCLPEAACHVVDTAVVAALHHSPAKILDLAAAKVIEADPHGHAARTEADRQRRYATLSKTDEAGMRHLIARVTAGDAAWIDATLARVADILTTRRQHTDGPVPDRDTLRAEALTWLARPAELLSLLCAHTADTPAPDLPAKADEPDEPDEPGEGAHPCRAMAFPADLLGALHTRDLTALRPKATLYLHLHEAALDGSAPTVARAEGLGPIPLDQLADLIGGRPVTVTPVLDLSDHVATSAYEFPEQLKERLHLLHHGDAFPHATARPGPGSARLDHDHVIPHDPAGPPGQTSTTNGQPLSRTTHRAKTHLGYACTPLWPGTVLWRTPHGLHRVVSDTGTHEVTAEDARALTCDDPVQRALYHLWLRHCVLRHAPPSAA